MVKLLMLFIVVPATELVLLIEVGRQIGTINTLLLIVATGVLGASLAGRQGVGVVRKIQTEMAAQKRFLSAVIPKKLWTLRWITQKMIMKN